MADKSFNVEIRSGNSDATTVIAVSGALVLENIFQFQTAWRSAAGDVLIIDLSGVPYMDSSAIGSLVNAHVSCLNKGKNLRLAGVPERLKQILTVTQVVNLFRFYPDVSSAEATTVAAAN